MTGSSKLEYLSWNFFSRSGFKAPRGCKYISCYNDSRQRNYKIIERVIQVMSPLKDLDKKKHQKDPNFLNCNQKEPMGKLDTARKQKKI